jgi:hypothetical protein
MLFERSFTSSDKAEFWSSKNIIESRNVFLSSHKKFWLDCEMCFHSFESSLCSIKKGSWCPYCANKKLCESKDCMSCFYKSFDSITVIYSVINGDYTFVIIDNDVGIITVA